MIIPFVDLQAQYRALQKEIDPVIADVLQNAQFILGPKVKAFEEAFAAYCGAKHCVGLNSGTAALQLLLLAHGIGPGDECILQANTFFATAEAVLQVGATPVLVDCEEDSALIDVAALAAAITPKTRAILPVHLFGQVADMDEINALAKDKNIVVIEDACQAHGATYKGRTAGSLADGAAFSFYPGKNLGAYGDAGAVTTDDDRIADLIGMLREHGMRVRYHHEHVGWNERMDGIQGAVLGVKLPHLSSWNERRRTLAAMYRRELADVTDVRFIAEKEDRSSVYHLCIMRTAKRDALQKYLAELSIQTGIHYPIPLHLQKPLMSFGYAKGTFPHSELLSEEMISLPMYAELSEDQVREVCGAIRAFFTA